MEDRRIKFRQKGQESFGKTNWVKAKSSPPKIDEENPELVNKVSFSKPVDLQKNR